MTMTGDDLGKLQDELCAMLVAQGRSSKDAGEIVFVATQAARDAIGRLTKIVGLAPENHRDAAVVIAVNIMERLLLAEIGLGGKGKGAG